MSNTNYEAQLKLDLCNFGLDPAQWNLIPIRDHIYILQNKQDRNFIMAGLSQSLKHWDALEILEDSNLAC